jgi:hypothetical protein
MVKTLRSFLLVCILVVLGGALFAQKLTVTGNAPTATDSSLNSAIEGAWNTIKSRINDDIGNINSKPEDLIRGFADSSIYASQGASQRGYAGYKLFAFTVGPAVGIKLPGSNPFGIMNELEDIVDTLDEKGDLKIGLDVQAISGQLSINTSSFLLDGLYLGIRFGYFKADNLIDDLGLKTISFGLVGNYQIVKEKSFAAGLVKWRGLSLGTGFIYQNTELSYEAAIGGQSESFAGGSVTVDPKLVLDLTSNTFTIPLEVATSVRLLWVLNLTLGAGVDIGFGNTKLDLGAKGDARIFDGSGNDITATPGNLTTSGGGTMRPTIFNPKLMGGFGFAFGPVILDVPITWYPVENGFSVGLTVGAVW